MANANIGSTGLFPTSPSPCKHQDQTLHAPLLDKVLEHFGVHSKM